MIPNKDTIYPLPNYQNMVLLKNVITSPNIEVGDYTYYHDKENGLNFEKNVLYHFDFIGDKLKIGKFCAIASDVQFIMNGANHQMTGISIFPFYIFGEDWKESTPMSEELPIKGDTIVGNDVWIGYKSTIMPGVKIGDGAIIAAHSEVTKDVEPYTVVGGNPAKLIRKRFDCDSIDRLLAIAWWNWDIEDITKALLLITGSDIDALELFMNKVK